MPGTSRTASRATPETVRNDCASRLKGNLLHSGPLKREGEALPSAAGARPPSAPPANCAIATDFVSTCRASSAWRPGEVARRPRTVNQAPANACGDMPPVTFATIASARRVRSSVCGITFPEPGFRSAKCFREYSRLETLQIDTGVRQLHRIGMTPLRDPAAPAHEVLGAVDRVDCDQLTLQQVIDGEVTGSGIAPYDGLVVALRHAHNLQLDVVLVRPEPRHVVVPRILAAEARPRDAALLDGIVD